MCQILLRDKETGLNTVHANIIKLTQNRVRKVHFLHYKIIGAPKKFNNWPRPLFRPRLELTMHVLKSQIHHVRQSL